jgi:hypothetical protein
MLRRFQSEPVLANPRLEPSNLKIKSDLRQSILYRHKQLTPMSDKRHPIRSTNLAQQQLPAGMKLLPSCHFRLLILSLVPTIPSLSFTSQSAQMPLPEQLWPGFSRALYGCYSTGNLGDNARLNPLAAVTHENHQHTNILGPKHFIVEEENEALLAKELQEAKIHSTHNSLSSMHSSQPHLLNYETNEFCLRHPNVRSRAALTERRCSMSYFLATDRSIGITFQILILLVSNTIHKREETPEEPLRQHTIAFYDR